MSHLGPKGFRIKYIGASVHPGDHGIRAADEPTDARRIGLIELTERLRWVPEVGEGWDVPISLVEVRTPPPRGIGLNGLLLAVPGVGVVRVDGRTSSGIFSLVTQRGPMTDNGATAMLRRDLLRRGAVDSSESGGADVRSED